MPVTPKDDANRVVAEETAKMLLEIDAVHFRTEPYIFTSGIASPVYIDCRKLISYPHVRSALMNFACDTIPANVGDEQFDCVAGGETAGIPFAALISERMNLPMIYVRKKPKGFGRNALIEGDMPEGSRVLLVEDLTTDGGSKIGFADAVRKAGGEVAHAFSIFYYDIFEDAPKQLQKNGMTLHYLATWWDVLAECKKTKKFSEETLVEVESFLGNPLKWSGAHGGISKKT